MSFNLPTEWTLLGEISRWNQAAKRDLDLSGGLANIVSPLCRVYFAGQTQDFLFPGDNYNPMTLRKQQTGKTWTRV